MSNAPAIKNQNQVATKERQGLHFSMPSAQEMQQLIDFCKVMASAPFYQKLGPGGVMAIYLTAKEQNIPFMACLNGGMHTFDGKVTFSAQLINAMIINAGHKADIVELTEERCIIHFKRGDRKDTEYKGLVYEYNIEQARKAGYLTKNNWKTSPKDMLFSRCLTGGGRKHMPEVFVGVLVTGELVGTDSDSNAVNEIPVEILNRVDEEPKKLEDPKKIENCPGFEDFVIKHNIGMDVLTGNPTRQREYILKTCEKAKMTETQVINAAVKNEQLFIDRFSKWEKETYPETQAVEEDSMKFEEQIL